MKSIELKQKIKMAQLHQLQKVLIPNMLSTVVVCFALSYILWGIDSQHLVKLYMTTIGFCVAFRFSQFFYFKNRQDERYSKQQFFCWRIGGLALGLSWGISCALLVLQIELNHQLLILCILAGISMASLPSISCYLPLFLLYIPIAILPTGVALLYLGGATNNALAVIVLCYVVAQIYYAKELNKSFKETIALRFENSELIDALRIEKEVAEKANLAKSRFLAAASHDLRQPLYAIVLFMSALEKSNREEKNQQIINKINNSLSSMHNLFDALMDISKLDSGVMRVEKERIELAELIIGVINEFDLLASEKGLTLSYQYESHTIHSDPNLLKQIISNLVSNAIRYTVEGGVRIEVHIENETLVLDVSDTGIGIASTQQEVIFEEFTQLHNPERDRSKGIGLGLAIVKRTCALLGHPLQLKSEQGVGTTFSLQLPLAKRSHITLDLKDEQPKKESNQHDVKTLAAILVIDNEPDILEGTKILLEQWGLNTVCARSLFEAKEMLKSTQIIPSAIIADYRLESGLTGLDAAEEILTAYHLSIPVLIVTGDIELEGDTRIVKKGFQLLSKPVMPAKLRAFTRNLN